MNTKIDPKIWNDLDKRMIRDRFDWGAILKVLYGIKWMDWQPDILPIHIIKEHLN